MNGTDFRDRLAQPTENHAFAPSPGPMPPKGGTNQILSGNAGKPFSAPWQQRC